MSRTSAILDSLERQPRWALVAEGAAWIVVVGVLDWATGSRVALSFFYMLPVAVAAWVGRRSAGMATAVATAAVWYVADAVGNEGWYSAVQFWNIVVRLAFLVFVVYVVASLRETLDEQRDLARRDLQTGLANARQFHERAEVELRRLARLGSPLTIAYCDVDNLKAVNDTYGHETGDQLLRLTGQALRGALRATDTVARMGGDEFALLLPETAAEAAAAALLKVQARADAAIAAAELGATVSIGGVWSRRLHAGVDGLLRQADAAMYTVKAAGKAGVLLCEDGTPPDPAAIRRPVRPSETVTQ